MRSFNDNGPAALVDWFVKNGGYWSPKVEIASNDQSGFRAVAKSPIDKGDKIVQCPSKLAISSEKAKEFYADKYPVLEDSNAALKTFFCHQKLKGAEGFWWPYIQMLPATFTTPYFYSDEEMEGLKGTNIYEESSCILDRWRDELSKVQLYFPEITWELYLWACNVFSSRSFPSKLLQDGSMERGNTKDQPILLPLVDLLNHHPRTPILWDDTEDGVSIKVMAAGLDTGEEIFNNYGPKGNEELIMGYGFSLEDNPFDTVCLKYPGRLYFLSRDKALPENLLDDVKELMGAQRDDLSLLVSLKVLLALIRALKAKISRISAAMLNPLQGSLRQQDIVRYRTTQHGILEKAAKECLSLIVESLKGPCSLTTQNSVDELQREALSLLQSNCLNVASIFTNNPEFAEAMYTCFGAEDLEELIDMSVEDELLVLYLGNLVVNSPKSGVEGWLTKMRAKYPSSEEIPDSAISLYESIIPACRQVAPKIFDKPEWNETLMMWAMTVIEKESFSNCLAGDQSFILTC